MNFVKWFRSEPHRDKYESDHPAFLAAREAWDASRKEALAQPEQEPWPNEPAGHMAGGVQPSKMTKSKAITAIYALFNAPHNADINLTGLNKVLDELMAQPEQEPVAWRNAALRVGEDLCSVGPFGYYDMTAKQWLDWALSVVTVHAPPPPQRKPLTDEEIADAVRDLSFPSITAIARAIETKIRRHWIGLTEDERTAIREAVQQYHKIEDWNYAKAVQFATELKLQEKNS